MNRQPPSSATADSIDSPPCNEDTGEMLKVRDVAARLSLSESKIYELVESGELPHYRFGGAIRVSERQVSEFLQRTRHDREERTPVSRERRRISFEHLKL